MGLGLGLALAQPRLLQSYRGIRYGVLLDQQQLRSAAIGESSDVPTFPLLYWAIADPTPLQGQRSSTGVTYLPP